MNLLIMTQNQFLFRFVGDCHVILACKMFIVEKGEEVLKKNLKRNYLTHLQSMSDFGLLSPAFIIENYGELLVSSSH